MGRPVEDRILGRLIRSINPWASIDKDTRFTCSCREETAAYEINDATTHTRILLPIYKTENPHFNVARWYNRRIQQFHVRPFDKTVEPGVGDDIRRLFDPVEDEISVNTLDLYLARPTQSSRFSAIQRNAAVTHDFKRTIPKLIVVVVHVNGQPARALIDMGSLADFVSLTLVEQLRLERVMLEKPLTIQLAVQGSRSKVNFGVRVRFQYQGTDYKRYFDVINLQNYDMILGTPFLYQHRVLVGLNSPRVVLGSKEPLEMRGPQVSVLESRATEVYEDSLERVRERLRELAQPLCSQAGATALPLLRAINHSIPLIDEGKIYPWRPSKCPEALRPLWIEKKNSYLKSRRWELTTARNTCPMLLITKPGTPIRLRVVVDLREWNKNTRKLSSPMPDMEGILRRMAKKPFRSIIDRQDAYEQIRVVPEHVERTAVTTPDGNMVSHVVQQGDCNALATYQALMNHIFGEYVGVFMDVYLDDTIIYSDTLDEHVQHVTTVFRILQKEKLYLSKTKLRFLCKEVKILGRVVTDDGIRMDPEKVDRVVNWKVLTNRTLCRGFVGAVGYLAEDIYKVRVPLGVLAEACAETRPYQWGYTEQRVFKTVKRYVAACAPHCRVPLDYSPGSDPIWVMTDACGNGIGGVVAQGHTWKHARVAAFYSAKMSSAQRNYPVHEQELMAGVETMLRHRDILQGVKFTWVTDHKSLTHILDQKGLSGQQARWMERLSEFDFEVLYVPGEENILPDALSRMYEFDAPGTIRSQEEYLQCDLDVVDVSPAPPTDLISAPLLVGQEAIAPSVRCSHRLADKDVDGGMPAPGTKRMPKRVMLRVGPDPGPSSGGGGGQPPITLAGPTPAEPVERQRETAPQEAQYPAPYAKGR